MKSKKRKVLRPKPLWLIYSIDFILFAVILLVFCYFHHVRMFYGLSGENSILYRFEHSDKTDATPNVHTVHEWEVKSVVKPDCTDGGYTLYECNICGSEKKYGQTTAKGHTPGEAVGIRIATDSESGYSGDIYCRECGAFLEKGYETPTTGHKNTVLINTANSTCTEKGYSGDVYCSDCAKIVARGAETSMLPHEYSISEVIHPSCYDEGYTLSLCVYCSAALKTDFKAMIPHRMNNNGKCVYCDMLMLDTSGDFGESFPEKFIQNENIVSLSEEDDILSYAEANGIVLKQDPDIEYISLYRSHDIFLTVTEINTQLYYAGTKKTYTVQYYVYDIYVRNLSNLSTSYSTSQRKSMANLIQATEQSKGEVVAAVNGDYMQNSNFCKVCIRNGNVFRYSNSVSGDVCVLNYDGVMKTYSFSEYEWDEIEAGKPYQVWNFGPALIDHRGQAITDYTSLDNYVVNYRHPRTAIGYFEPGHYAFIVVDGRSDDSDGVRIVQLAELFVGLGCKTAYNMDGGDSAQAWVNNTPIREDQDRGSTQRALWDIICVSENS